MDVPSDWLAALAVVSVLAPVLVALVSSCGGGDR